MVMEDVKINVKIKLSAPEEQRNYLLTADGTSHDDLLLVIRQVLMLDFILLKAFPSILKQYSRS
jgi:hypothetical protein